MTKALNERIAKATDSVGLIVRGLDGIGTIFACVQCLRKKQLEAGLSVNTLYAWNYTSNYRAAIRYVIYAPSQAPIIADTNESSESSGVNGNRCHSGVPTNATDASWGCSGTTETRIAIVVSSWSGDSAHS